MDKRYADMHIHTWNSDGTDSPDDIVFRALQQDINVIAITDHNTTEGVKSAQAAAGSSNILIVPGIELSIAFEMEMHILGYFIDIDNIEIKRYVENKRRAEFTESINLLRKIRKKYVNIDISDFLEERKINFKTIASVLVRKGVETNENDVRRYLFGKGGELRIEQEELSPQNGIKLILNAGGVPVLAHPGRIGLKDNALFQMLKELKRLGLTGLECYHSSHTVEQEKTYINMCKQLDLKVSGGSDYHGEQSARCILEHNRQIDTDLTVLSSVLNNSYGLRFMS